jgi:hypothetical protein
VNVRSSRAVSGSGPGSSAYAPPTDCSATGSSVSAGRVSGSRLQQPPSDLLPQSEGYRVQHLTRHLVRQRAQVQHRQAGTAEAVAEVPGDGDQNEGIGPDPPRHEPEHIEAGTVHPVGVLGDHQQRRLRRRVRQKGQRGQADEAQIGDGLVDEPDGPEQRGALTSCQSSIPSRR